MKEKFKRVVIVFGLLISAYAIIAQSKLRQGSSPCNFKIDMADSLMDKTFKVSSYAITGLSKKHTKKVHNLMDLRGRRELKLTPMEIYSRVEKVCQSRKFNIINVRIVKANTSIPDRIRFILTVERVK